MEVVQYFTSKGDFIWNKTQTGIPGFLPSREHLSHFDQRKQNSLIDKILIIKFLCHQAHVLLIWHCLKIAKNKK
jgi:hypothetical protein